MAMPENEIIEMLFSKNFFRVNGQVFFVIAKIFFIVTAGCNTTFSRPVTGHAYSQVGMNTCKKPLTNTACKNFFNEFVSVISRPKPVSMSYIKFFSVVFFLNGSTVKLYI